MDPDYTAMVSDFIKPTVSFFLFAFMVLRFSSSPSGSEAAELIVRNYIEWQTRHNTADFVPCADDDIDLRTYLMYLRTNGADLAALEERAAALEQFYRWAQTEGIIAHNPC